MREAYRRAYLQRNDEQGRVFSEAWRRQQERWFATEPFADTLPAFQGLIVSREGDFWVERYRVSWDLQHQRSVGGRLYDEESTWDVFERSGTWLTIVRLPARFTLLDVSGSRVLGLVANEDDEQGVRVLELVKPTR